MRLNSEINTFLVFSVSISIKNGAQSIQSRKSSLQLTLQQTLTLHQVHGLTVDLVLLPTRSCLAPLEASEGIQQAFSCCTRTASPVTSNSPAGMSERSSDISDCTFMLMCGQLNCTSVVLVLSTINGKRWVCLDSDPDQFKSY